MRRLLGDAGVALLGFTLVFALVFIAGRAFLPGTGIDLAAAIPPVAAPEPDVEEEPDPAAIMQALHARRATIEGSGGALLATGAFEGEHILERVEILGDFCPECGAGVFGQTIGVETGLPMDLNVRYSGNGVSFRVIADHVEIGVPRTDDMTIVVNSDRLSFTAEPGQCTLDLLESAHSVRPASFGNFLFIRSFVAQIECTDLVEIRGGGRVSVLAAFSLDVEDE